MKSARKAFEERARKNYESELSYIDKKVKSFYLMQYTCERWMFGDLERESTNEGEDPADVYFPVFANLKLSKTDDLCQEGMLFLEELEEKTGVEATEYKYNEGDGLLKSFRILDCVIRFFEHGEGRCRILETKEETLETVTKTKKRIVCI